MKAVKIIAVDNYDREHIADILIAENVQQHYAEGISDYLQSKYGGSQASRYYKAVANDYKLWRGMEELA